MKAAVIRFPGSNCDLDAVKALGQEGFDAKLVWHRNFDSDFDAVVLPGGFSYGDRLRSGIIAAYSPAMKKIRKLAEKGVPVLGICNGFQILVEGGLLPGALLRNDSLRFICRWVTMSIENGQTPFTKFQKQNVRMPIAHGEGKYYIDDSGLKELYKNSQVAFKYQGVDGLAVRNPNGSVDDIAGICNKEGNVLGLMPHPERASDPLLGGEDGRLMFRSLLRWLG